MTDTCGFRKYSHMTYKQRAIVSGTIAVAAAVVAFAFGWFAVAGGPAWNLIVAAVGVILAVVEAHHACANIVEHEYREYESKRKYEDNYKL